MEEEPPEYDEYVEHPRYGRGPRITGFEPQEAPEIGFYFCIFPPESRIPYTAIRADTKRQQPDPFPTLAYFDQKKICIDCKKPFIFFAEEQQFWFEELEFNRNADCVRCFPCREQHRLAKGKKFYPPVKNQKPPGS